ncbi:MAG TPA: dockerin type I domain-containing protein, partial [Tepidisphaeraceae bacterium]|nr:dockerin type I domain-containing protein [Tepidisphaeraceae bacterium]
GGSWNTAGNWSGGVPSGATARANFLSGPGLTAPATITVDGNRTVGQLTFNNASAYTIAPGTGGTLTIDDSGDGNGGGGPLITVNNGNHTISAPVALTNGLTVSTAAGTSVTTSGGISGSGGLTKTGSGSITLGGTNNFGDITISTGTLTLASTATLNSTSVNAFGGTFIANGSLNPLVTINSASPVTLGATTGASFLARPATAVNLGPTGSVTLAPAATRATRQVLIMSALNFSGSTNAWQGKLDVTNNDLIVQGGSLVQVTNQIKSGLGAANWNGAAGITSANAAADAQHLTALGIIQNNDGTNHPIYGMGTIYGKFDGQNPSLNDILVKYTYYGDADLNGMVDGGDYSKIDNGFNTNMGVNAGWTNGDFNYDGVVDGADYALIDNAFMNQGTALGAAVVASPTAMVAASSGFSSSSVPEPATAGIIATLAATVLSRRSRRR